MDAQQSWRSLPPHSVGDDRAPVSPLRDIALVSQTSHELVPRAAHPLRIPASIGGPLRESIAWHRGNDDIERVLGRAAMRSGIGQRLDRFYTLQDRARPSVRDQQRHGVRMLRADMDEMDV